MKDVATREAGLDIEQFRPVLSDPQAGVQES